MSKSNEPLVDQLGADYVNEFFRGTMFAKGNLLYKIHSCDGRILRINTLDNTNHTGAWGTIYEDAKILTKFEDVAWPKLGYRNLKHSVLGNVVVYVGSQRSVLRGIRPDSLSFESLPVCDLLYEDAMHGPGAGSDKYRYLKVFFPEWLTYKEGMNLIKDKKIPAFAMDEDLAVGLSVESGPDRFCDIYFRQKVVGTIAPNGEMAIANRVIKKGHMRALYKMLED